MEKTSNLLSLHIQRLEELVKRINNHAESVSRIEIDMLLEELRHMYDTVCIIRQSEEHGVIETATPDNTVKEEQTTEENKEECCEETVKEDFEVLMIDNNEKPQYAEEEEESTESTQEHFSIEDPEANTNDGLFEEDETPETEEEEPAGVVTAEHPSEQTKVPENKPEEKGKPVQPSLFDYFKHSEDRTSEGPNVQTDSHTVEQTANPPEEQPKVQTLGHREEQAGMHKTLADTLGEMRKGTVERNAVSKVSDLRTIININDKFSFMNELFHNNMKAYNDFILRLNAISDRDEAMKYVEDIASQYSWDMESIAVITFFSIFDRKFFKD